MGNPRQCFQTPGKLDLGWSSALEKPSRLLIVHSAISNVWKNLTSKWKSLHKLSVNYFLCHCKQILQDAFWQRKIEWCSRSCFEHLLFVSLQMMNQARRENQKTSWKAWREACIQSWWRYCVCRDRSPSPISSPLNHVYLLHEPECGCPLLSAFPVSRAALLCSEWCW